MRRIKITDAALKRKVLDALYYGIGKPSTTAGCFSPRHGIRANFNDAKVELAICFECSNYHGAMNSVALGGGISNAPQEFYNSLLSSYTGH